MIIEPSYRHGGRGTTSPDQKEEIVTSNNFLPKEPRMLVKDLKEVLADIPDDFSVELGKFMALDTSKEEMQGYKIRLDFPMLGIAKNDTDKELVFVVGGKGEESLCWLLEFGKVEKINEPT